MAKSASTSNSILNLIYLAAAWADVAENDASSPATVIDVALHTAAPAGNSQTSNEASYTGYARLTVTRNGTGWTTPSGGSLSNNALLQFAECTGGSNTITHVSTGIGGTILHSGALTASRTVTSGIQPQFAANALVVTES